MAMLQALMEHIHLSVSEKEIFETSDKFLSVAIDISHIIGKDWWHPDPKKSFRIHGNHDPEPFDFSNGKLIELAKPLAPAYLRISGTKSDELLYFKDLSREQFDAMNIFARTCNFEIIFGLNAGKNVRDKKKRWTTENAEAVLAYTQEKKYPVAVWEFGNEINAFALRGRNWKISAKQYCEDFVRARSLIKSFSKDCKVAGPSSAFWPLIGEIFPVTKSFLKKVGNDADIISWHYYPQQSERSIVTTRRALPHTMLRPKHLDSINRWIQKIEKWKEMYSPQSELWMTETGNAQCGGQPGVSDVFIGSLWWLDQLGFLAKKKHSVVVRQTLSGSNYGLIDYETMEPNPDYWASVLWKKLMGRKVFDVSGDNAIPYLRMYAHECAGDEQYKVILLINIHKKKSFSVSVHGAQQPVELYSVTASDSLGKNIQLNGKELQMEKDILPISKDGTIVVAALSYMFIKITK